MRIIYYFNWWIPPLEHIQWIIRTDLPSNYSWILVLIGKITPLSQLLLNEQSCPFKTRIWRFLNMKTQIFTGFFSPWQKQKYIRDINRHLTKKTPDHTTKSLSSSRPQYHAASIVLAWLGEKVPLIWPDSEIITGLTTLIFLSTFRICNLQNVRHIEIKRLCRGIVQGMQSIISIASFLVFVDLEKKSWSPFQSGQRLISTLRERKW